MAKKNYQSKEPGANRKILEHALAANQYPRVDLRNPQAIKDRINIYWQYCLDHDVLPSVAGCANWLGISVDAIHSWYTGRRGSIEHQKIANDFYIKLQDIWAQNMQESNIDNISGMFMGKVFFGYKETQEIIVKQNDYNELSAEDLIAESKLLPGAEVLALPDNAQVVDIKPTIVDKYAVPDKDLIDDRYQKSAERQAKKDCWNDKERQKARKLAYDKAYLKAHPEADKANKKRYLERKKMQRAAERAQKEQLLEKSENEKPIEDGEFKE